MRAIMPKKKGDKGGNPSPVQTEAFRAKQKPKADVELGEPISFRLPVEIDALVRPLENRGEWLRRVVTEAAQKELMKG